ncbi:A24 family peptidase [Enterobacteriaceae bacterium H16N7]|nr:A24 family peptidase [Dryocola clanedunensis]
MTSSPPLPLLIFIAIYSGLLIRLSWIDFKARLLPDNLTYPLLWSGLLYQALLFPDHLSSAVWGAVAGYMSLWLLYWFYFFLRRSEGIGYGDMKLLAALGAWHGWQSLPGLVVTSAVIGIVLAVFIRLLRRGEQRLATTPLPFGPCLAIAGGVTGWCNEHGLILDNLSFTL